MKRVLSIVSSLAASLLPASLLLGAGQTGLRTTAFPDGTGSIGLPAGWEIASANRGQVAASDGKGAAVVLGMPWTVLKTGTSLDEFDTSRTPKAASGDLLRALGEVLAKNAGSRLLSVRSRPAPSPVPGARAAYLFYEMESGGGTLTAVGYFAALDPGPTSPSWTLYASAVMASKARFARTLPTMMAMWRSWRANGADPLRGSQSAELDEILKDRRDSYERIQAAFRREL